MSRAGALSSIGSSPGRLAVLRSPVASARLGCRVFFLAFMLSSLSCSFSLYFTTSLLCAKNETHPILWAVKATKPLVEAYDAAPPLLVLPSCRYVPTLQSPPSEDELVQPIEESVKSSLFLLQSPTSGEEPFNIPPPNASLDFAPLAVPWPRGGAVQPHSPALEKSELEPCSPLAVGISCSTANI